MLASCPPPGQQGHSDQRTLRGHCVSKVVSVCRKKSGANTAQVQGEARAQPCTRIFLSRSHHLEKIRQSWGKSCKAESSLHSWKKEGKHKGEGPEKCRKKCDRSCNHIQLGLPTQCALLGHSQMSLDAWLPPVLLFMCGFANWHLQF